MFSDFHSTPMFSQPQSSRAVRRCTTLSQKTRESWASTRAISSPWPIRLTRTGMRACWMASQDSSLSTTSRSLFRCPTNIKKTTSRVESDGEEEERTRRIRREEGKWSQGMVHRRSIFTFSSSVITDEHLLSPVSSGGDIWKSRPEYQPIHPKVKGSRLRWTPNITWQSETFLKD